MSMKLGDLRRFKVSMPLKSDRLEGKPFLVLKERLVDTGDAHLGDAHLVSFLLDGKVWELNFAWVLRNSEAHDEAG